MPTNRREHRHEPPILVDFPESFETERLLIRSPLPGDGPELYAAIRESSEDLSPWMAWPNEQRTIEAGGKHAEGPGGLQARSELRLHLYLKGNGHARGHPPACRA